MPTVGEVLQKCRCLPPGVHRALLHFVLKQPAAAPAGVSDQLFLWVADAFLFKKMVAPEALLSVLALLEEPLRDLAAVLEQDGPTDTKAKINFYDKRWLVWANRVYDLHSLSEVSAIPESVVDWSGLDLARVYTLRQEPSDAASPQ